LFSWQGRLIKGTGQKGSCPETRGFLIPEAQLPINIISEGREIEKSNKGGVPLKDVSHRFCLNGMGDKKGKPEKRAMRRESCLRNDFSMKGFLNVSRINK